MGGESIPIGRNFDGSLDSTRARLSFLEVLYRWIFTVDHKKLGILYISYGLLFLLVAGVEALIIRIQLFFPHNTFVSPYVFNRMFTMHGTTMVFFVGMPLIFGFANYLVPLMIGARDMAFPRLNAFSFWISAFGGLLLYYSFIGWKRPAGDRFRARCGMVRIRPTDRTRLLARSQQWTIGHYRCSLSGIGSIGTAINILATVSLHAMQRDDPFEDSVAALALRYRVMPGLVAVSPLTACQIMLMIDRYLGGHFFDTQAGGSAMLWVHFFWIFGHPEVYVLVLPAFAFANEIIPGLLAQSDLRLSGHGGGIGRHRLHQLGVWAHHMFTVGMTSVGNTFFMLSTMAGRGSHRHQDIQLAGHHVGRKDPLRRTHAVLR